MADLSYVEALEAARERFGELDRELPVAFVVNPGATRLLRRGEQWVAITRVEYVLGTVRVEHPDQPGSPW